jgi:hypothetical protein
MSHKSQNLGIRDMSQRHPLLDGVKHQYLTAIYVHNSEAAVGGSVFSSVCNKAIYKGLGN